jgi:hypothetical protein
VKKFLTGAVVVALPLLTTIGTGAAVAATGYPHPVVEHAANPALQSENVYRIGYFLPNGAYVTTCHRVVVGYTWRGWPIVRTFCR